MLSINHDAALAPRIFTRAGFTTTEQQMIATLVLGYCLMQFDNGTSSGLSWLSVGMPMMCIAGYAMSAAPVLRNLAAEMP